MIRLSSFLLLAAVLLSLLQAQRRRDPLTQPEVALLRDQAQDPELRLKLYIQFARQRLDAVDKIRGDLKAADRGKNIRDGLQDFLDVYDELDDNVNTYAHRGADLRKALKAVINADVEFQGRLRAIQDAAKPDLEETRLYDFSLQAASDTVDGSAKDHRELLTEQEEAAKHKKKSH